VFGFVRTGVDHGPFVRELVTAPKLRIRPHRVAVVLTTRVTGDLRLLRILAIDSGTSRTTKQRNRWGRMAKRTSTFWPGTMGSNGPGRLIRIRMAYHGFGSGGPIMFCDHAPVVNWVRLRCLSVLPWYGATVSA